MQSQLQDPEVEAADYREAVEALRAAPPIKEPLRLTRQSARRLAMQVAWAQLQPLRDVGVNRAERRRMWHNVKFSAAARELVARSLESGSGSPQPTPQA